MSLLPRSIHSVNNENENHLDGTNSSSRRKSIAKLTRSPLSGSPIIPQSPHRFGSKSNSFSANAPFLKKHLSRYEDDAIDTQSSVGSSKGNDVFHNSDEDNEPPISLSGDETNFASGIDDPKLLQQINKHLNNDDNPLQVEGGDITHDIYKLGSDLKFPKRSRSLSSSDFDRSSRRGSFASSLNVPGGFRREFIIHNNMNSSEVVEKRNASFLTRNFVEFLSIYGHFAGETLENEDDIACHYKSVGPNQFGLIDEESPLIYSQYGDNGKNVINPNGTATDTKAYFLLLKAFVGTGVLFLPKAFSNGGLLFSILTLLFFGVLSYWCYLILVYAKIATKVSGFGEIGLKLYGKGFQNIILSSIIISQIGFVAAYIVFTAENLRAFTGNISGINTDDMNIIWFILFQVIILVPLSLIRDITKLSLTALLANIFIFLGLLTILYFTFEELVIKNSLNFGPEIDYFFNHSEFSLFIGVAIFAFEGIGLIIPIQESMIYTNHFPKVLFKVIMTISGIFIFIGSFGYVTFGKNIKTVILLNLPQDSPFIILIQLLYAFAILLSTPIQLFPAIRLVEQKLFKSNESGKNSFKIKWLKNLVRCLFVIFTSIIALYGGQNLDRFVSFVGCFACIPLVYMYPPILHLKSCCDYSKDNEPSIIQKKYWLGILDYFLVTIGSIALVYTTYDILAQ